MDVSGWKSQALRQARTFAFEGTPAERAFRIVTAAIVLAGLWFRVRGFLFSTTPLWLDEATWAVRLMDKPLLDDNIRPVAFMAITRSLARLLGPSETVLRLMPWCAGIATTFMAPALGSRLFRSGAARLLFVSAMALGAGAIDLSKEFKPYSIGLALHTALVLLTLRYCDDGGKRRDLAGILLLTTISVLFAQDVMFAFPGVFLVLAISVIRSRRFWHLAAVGLGVALSLAVIVSLYVVVWSKMNKDNEAKYWGGKYDVFYVPGKGTPNKTDWTAKHYAQIAAMPGVRRTNWTPTRPPEKRFEELQSIDSLVWLSMHLAGLALILRTRRLREGLLLVVPLVVTTTFNVLGFWPLGDFRTNLFALVYASAIAAFGVERNPKRIRWEDFIPAGALVFVPLFAFERNWHATKDTYTTSSEYPKALKALMHLQSPGYPGAREKLVADPWTCEPWHYYLRYHPTYSVTLGRKFRERLQLVCPPGKSPNLLAIARRELKHSSARVWLFASKHSVITKLERTWPDDLERIAFQKIGGFHIVAGVTTKDTSEPPPATEPSPPPEAPSPPEQESDSEASEIAP